jgi:hypothetical protein
MNDNRWVLEVLCDLLRSIALSKWCSLLLSASYIIQCLHTTNDQTKQGLCMVMHICTVRYRPVICMPFLFWVRQRKGQTRWKQNYMQTTCLMRSALFWDITQRREAGSSLPTLLTAYRCHLQGSRFPRRIINPWRWDRLVVPKRR